MQVRLLLELEESMPVLCYYAKRYNCFWYLSGSAKPGHRKKQLEAWDQRIEKLKESLVRSST